MKSSPLDALPTVADDPLRLLASCPASVCFLPVAVFPIPGDARMVDDVHPTNRIFVAHSGTGRRWYRQGRHVREMYTAPGMIEIYGKGLHFDDSQWAGEAGRSVLIEFPDEEVEALTHGELRSLPLVTAHEAFDEQISGLALALAEEVLAGLPDGRLYAQGLCLALLGLLKSRHAAREEAVPAPPRGCFPVAQRHRIADFIRSHLAADLSIEAMAEQTGISSFHFARLFKQSFGMTPHRYVQAQRLSGAVTALQKEPRKAIADVAIQYGFASQSHMTDLMRRKLGTTPRQLRGRP